MRDATEIVFAMLVIIIVILTVNVIIQSRFGSNWLFASIPITLLLGINALVAFAQIDN